MYCQYSKPKKYVKRESVDNFKMFIKPKIEKCPYCESKFFIKRGVRKNKLEIVQLYECKNPECCRTFTAKEVKGKKFPLNIIIEAISYYNLGFTLETACRLVKEKFKSGPDPETLSRWLAEFGELCRFERLRPWAVKMFSPQDMVETVTMAHRQLFRFRYHRAKMKLVLEEFGNRYFYPLKEYLDNVSSETPHQYFQQGERMSEIRSRFDKSGMIVKSKFNYANRLANFVLGAVKANKERHEQLQRFMIANDSVTVATEVPVYIRKEDIEHMQNVLDFQVVGEEGIVVKRRAGRTSADIATRLKPHRRAPSRLPKLLTGHIDFVQVRNRSIHLLDYKANAAKERPIEQLTWYALALSRLTGLRLFDFKCGWFDEKEYYEFFPLHVVKKLKGKKKRKIVYRDGTWVEAPRKNLLKIV